MDPNWNNDIEDLVCHTLSGNYHLINVKRPLTTQDSEAYLAKMLECWQILPSLNLNDLTLSVGHFLRDDDCSKLEAAVRGIKLFSKLQWKSYTDVLEKLPHAGFRYCLMKGAASALVLYPDSESRTCWDIDLAVGKGDTEAARAFIHSFGYVNAQLNGSSGLFEIADDSQRIHIESQHYELAYLVRRQIIQNLSMDQMATLESLPWLKQYIRGINEGRPWCYTVFDVHHGLSLDIPTDKILDTASHCVSLGMPLSVPSIEWMGLHLIFKIYWEGVHNYGKGVYQFSDLCRLITRCDSTLFGKLVDLMYEYNLVAAGHYVLRRLPSFTDTIPPFVIDFIKGSASPPTGSLPKDINDLGDMWAKLWRSR